MITIPSNIVSDMLSAVGGIMDGITTAIIVFIGVSVALYIARQVKTFMPRTGSK